MHTLGAWGALGLNAGCLDGSLVAGCWLAGCWLAGWLPGWLLAGCLAGWLATGTQQQGKWVVNLSLQGAHYTILNPVWLHR